ncbi:MAG: T9SS type A sorting domain-containing protein [Bacteroidetes bacterium]|nr:T9SS type A sorting domain-containing protein [Bacteroidota bacterium]
MKYIILILLIWMVSFAHSNAQWQRLLSERTFSITANPLNPKTIYVGGKGRVLYRSYNAGKTWDTVVINFRDDRAIITNIYINSIDTTIMMIGGINLTTIIRSADGGKTWENSPEFGFPLTLSGESMIEDVNNPSVIYFAQLRGGIIYKSIDTGKTWKILTKSLPVNDVCSLVMLPNSNTIIGGADNGFLVKSIDGGSTWDLYRVVPFNSGGPEIPKIVFSTRNKLLGYAVVTYFYQDKVDNGGLYRTTNGGETWENIYLRDTSLWTIAIRRVGNEDELFVGGYTDDSTPIRTVPGNSVVRHSQNSGSTWDVMDNAVDWVDTIRRNVWMMKFVNTSPVYDRLYMATESGFFVFEMPVSVDEHEVQPSSDGIQISPNPVSTSLTVSGLDGVSEVKVVNSLGMEVLSQQVISHTSEFDVSGLASGMYVVQFRTPTGTTSKLIIVNH